MESIVLNVKDLEAGERKRYEGVLGRPLEDDQQIILTVVPASEEPSRTERQRAWIELQQLSSKAEGHLRKRGTTSAEWEAAVDEACHEVRYGKPSE